MPLPDEKEPDLDLWKYAAENSPRWLNEDVDAVWPWIAPAMSPLMAVPESTPILGPAVKYVSDIGKGAAKAAAHQLNPFEAVPGTISAWNDPWVTPMRLSKRSTNKPGRIDSVDGPPSLHVTE